MDNPELTPNPNNFEQQLNQIYKKPFFTGENNWTRKSCFVAIIGYALEQGIVVSLGNFNPIKLIQEIAQKLNIAVPSCLESLASDSQWQDEWNQEILNFDKQVQKQLKSYQTAVSMYRNSNAG